MRRGNGGGKALVIVGFAGALVFGLAGGLALDRAKATLVDAQGERLNATNTLNVANERLEQAQQLVRKAPPAQPRDTGQCWVSMTISETKDGKTTVRERIPAALGTRGVRGQVAPGVIVSAIAVAHKQRSQ